MKTRSRVRVTVPIDSVLTEIEKDRIKKIFIQNKNKEKKKTNVSPIDQDPNISTDSNTNSFLSTSSNFATKQEIEDNNLVKNNTSDSENGNICDLEEKINSSTESNPPTNENPSPTSTKKNSNMGSNGTDERLDKLVGVVEKLAIEVAGKILTGNDNEGTKEHIATVLGSLQEGQLSKLNLKITEVEAIKTHPWLSHYKIHNSKLQRIPTELNKIEDKIIKKCIYTYIRNKKNKLEEYDKLLLMMLERDPETSVTPSFLVRMVNYLDEENASGEVSEAKFLLKASEIDRIINKEEMENLRKQLTQAPTYSSSSKSKSFSSWANNNKKIDKYAAWKEKYPNYKGFCLDFNFTGACKRGEGCGYKHECLRCYNLGEGNCDRSAKVCEE